MITTSKNASYIYNDRIAEGFNFMLITDNKDGQPVTKTIDFVVKQISSIEGIAAKDYIWLYQDQSGIVDGYDVESHGFVMIGANNFEDAINVFTARKKRHHLADVRLNQT